MTEEVTPMSSPSPLSMPSRKPVPAPPDKMPSRKEVYRNIAIAPVTDLTPGKIVRPARRPVMTVAIDDGVRKTKFLVPGMRVRPYLNGEARGGERVVQSVERVNNDTAVRVTFSSGHPTQEYKHAYRWVDLDAIGKQITVRQSAEHVFVEVHA